MSTRLMVRGFATVATLAIAAAFTVSAFAQPAPVPVRVGQASDGTLFVVQGNNTWTLVPDQLTDSDVAALNPTGEIDGTFPNDVFVVQAPAAPPAAAPAPPAAAPAPAPAPPAAAPPPPADATIDLTGKAATSLPGTPIDLGATYSSVVDSNTRPRDVFSVALSAGVTYRFFYSSPGNATIANGVYPQLLNPDAKTPAANGAGTLANFTPAKSGTYYLVQQANGSGLRYTFSIRQ